MKVRRFALVILLALLALTACQQNQAEADQTTSYAGGQLHYPVLLNGVGIQVNQAGLLAVQDEINPDYAHIVLSLSVTNQSEYDVVPPTMTLVDAHGNIYPYWRSPLPYEDQISRLPLTIPTGQSGIGNLVFVVPDSAVRDNLRLRWDSGVHQARIDISLGAISPGVN